MKSTLATTLALLGATTALPAVIRDADPLRILPPSWRFDIQSYHGPGCPKDGPSSTFLTQPTFGSNTVDGSEICFWHFAYPHFEASIGPGIDEGMASTWCETTLKYTEYSNYTADSLASDNYRLRLHKNGTSMIASYDLDEGVNAKWKFTYYLEDDDEVVDEILVKGPVKSPQGQFDISDGKRNMKVSPLPRCGAATIKYRMDVTVSSTKPQAKGKVFSELRTYQGKTEMYGVQSGVSYDWQKCDE